MDIQSPFLNWLHCDECKPGLANTYHYAVISENLRELFGQDHASISEFDILEEIENEKQMRTESQKLRELLLHLLTLARPDSEMRVKNFMIALRAFVDSLFSGRSEKSFLPYKKFHELSGEVKLWIMHALLQYTEKDKRHPKPIGRDSAGNLYFIVNESLLYVQYGTELQEATRADDEKKLTQMEKSLHRGLLSLPRWKLLADSESGWSIIAMILESFDEVNIAERITKALKKDTSISVIEDQKEPCNESVEESQFQREPKRKSRTQLKKPKTVTFDDVVQQSDGSTSNSPITVENISNEGNRELSSPDNSSQEAQSPVTNLKTVRCMYWPNCTRSDENCHFIHPNQKCKKFGTAQCPGMYCRFLHPECLEDGHCENIQCPFEHKKSMSSLRRSHYAKMNSARLSDDFDERMSVSDHLHHRSREPSPPSRREPVRTVTSPVHNERPFSNKELRCHYFPRCTKPADKCAYAHPRDHCAPFPNCLRGRDCPFLHGPCMKDGHCMNQYCPHEHYQQVPPRASFDYQMRMMKKREQ